jgi:hypothetical protein
MRKLRVYFQDQEAGSLEETDDRFGLLAAFCRDTIGAVGVSPDE